MGFVAERRDGPLSRFAALTKDDAAMTLITRGTGPHTGRPVATAGASLDDATAALILVHGRGGNATEMLGLVPLVASPSVAFLAPPAAGHTWYPQRFTEPTSRNGPDLS